MVDTFLNVDEQVSDVVVCDKRTVNELMLELEARRKQALWIPRDSAMKPEPAENGYSTEVLIHYRRPGQQPAITTGRYVQSCRQWHVRGEDCDSTAYVIGWHAMPIPQYGTK